MSNLLYSSSVPGPYSDLVRPVQVHIHMQLNRDRPALEYFQGFRLWTMRSHAYYQSSSDCVVHKLIISHSHSSFQSREACIPRMSSMIPNFREKTGEVGLQPMLICGVRVEQLVVEHWLCWPSVRKELHSIPRLTNRSNSLSKEW